MEFYEPYKERHVNVMYNVLFCDEMDLFKNEETMKGEGVWSTLLADDTDVAALHKIAEDDANEGRVRALAFNRLRASGDKVPPRILLGVVIEVPLEQGLDVLAAFAEGGVRYLNQSGKVAIFEGENHPVELLAKELIELSRAIVNRIGPWSKQRLPPPQANVRMSFLVSDGLYFGEGPFHVLQADPLAGAVLAKATELVSRVVELSIN